MNQYQQAGAGNKNYIALLCDDQGITQDILAAQLHDSSPVQLGKPVEEMFIPGSQDRARDMVAKLHERGTAFGYALTLTGSQNQLPLLFSGGRTPSGLYLIVGAATQASINMFFFSELMKINNEQTNALRQAFKQNISRRNFMAVREDDDDDAQQTFEEFTKVNNELLATQRTLNKKNAQLDHLNRELSAKNQQLEEALQQVRELSGLLPVCSHCKKVRDDKGYWNELADYLSEHSDVMISHSICPQCSSKLRQELEEQD